MSTDFNHLFQLAFDYIQFTNENIFLTGKAGTGKTTFLKHVIQHSTKQTAVIAPTGVAAINAGGTTIHSFFQLPFSPFIPGPITHNFSLQDVHQQKESVVDKHHLLGRIKLNREKRDVIQQLELLIIDEISMVRCDIIDAIDTVMRSIRNRLYEPFGGVQVLLIGDMHQLPPVIPTEEWQFLQQFYDSPYFFSSKVMQQQAPVYIELEKIYRQSDFKFIEILNKVRNHQLDDEALEILNEQYQPQFSPSKTEGYITLTTHNAKAQTLNQQGLQHLLTNTERFTATIEGDFSDKAFPAEEVLELKIGAQVMFIKNDKEKIRRYFNGKIGTIDSFDDEAIYVVCDGDDEPIKVLKEKWENIKYTLNNTTQQIEESVIGSFTQYPLRLAWAITIHKSQGLTFQKAIIDAGSAFAAGQVYVALSRCTNLQGLVLTSKISNSNLFVDERIVQFSKSKSNAIALENNLLLGKQLYKQKILIELFSFNKCLIILKDINAFFEIHNRSFLGDSAVWLQDFSKEIQEISSVSEKFVIQLNQLFLQNNNEVLQQRVVKATAYFLPLLQSVLQNIQECSVTTDSRNYAKEFHADLYKLYAELYIKNELLNTCVYGFDMFVFQEKKMKIQVPSLANTIYAGTNYKKIETPHPELYQQLRLIREQICSTKNLPIYMVASSKTLEELVTYLPQNTKELEQITGFGSTKIEKFGSLFINAIVSFSQQHQLQSFIHQKSIPKQEKVQRSQNTVVEKESTTDFTLRLHKQGLSVEAIVAERNLAKSTIEGHLALLVKDNVIDVFTLLDAVKVNAIVAAIEKLQSEKATDLMQELGNNYSYSDLRYGINYYRFKYANKKTE